MMFGFSMVPLIFMGVIALIVVFAILGHLQAKKRREELFAWATGKGLSYAAGRDTSVEMRHLEFKDLRRGDGGRYAYNIMSGAYRGRPLLAFDYHYETHSTDDKGNRTTQSHHFSAVIVQAEIPLKPLSIRPEGIFDKLGAVFGFEDINFESAEFSRRYKVTAPDRRWAYDVLHARAIEYLLAKPPFSLQFGQGNRVIHAGSTTWNVSGFEAAANLVSDLLDLLPDYVKKQQQGGPPPLPGGPS